MTRHHGEICSNLCRTNWDWHINNLAFYKPSSLKKGTFAHSQTVRCNKSRSARSNSEIVCLFGYCKKLSSGEPGSRNTAERSGRNFNDIGKNIMPLTTQRSANQVGKFQTEDVGEVDHLLVTESASHQVGLLITTQEMSQLLKQLEGVDVLTLPYCPEAPQTRDSAGFQPSVLHQGAQFREALQYAV
ncbi:hypothetical protein T265_04112 [Opisthorchis viverrini]|uniref:Uncharacterized protein n=1 Tax=Opisthorchis viverrini TaxID=6198 RepID=A0A074ZTX8_OPIVI|nr:hypothetical protein T265_04112 [Opisthorchis viverrini]KER29272.1 hypothetical protein T265_04112 [Opisthorchis viverrini]